MRHIFLICPAGEIMISAMGDAQGKPKGGFVLLDEDFKVAMLSHDICHADPDPDLGQHDHP